MGLETEIVQDVVIEEGGEPEAAKDDKPYNPTNPIFEVKPEEEPAKKEEAKPEPKATKEAKPAPAKEEAPTRKPASTKDAVKDAVKEATKPEVKETPSRRKAS